MEGLDLTLRAVSSALRYPVIIILIILLAVTLVLLGWIIVEGITERSRLKVEMPKLIDAVKKKAKPTRDTIMESSLLKRQKAMLCEITMHPNLSNEMREAMALRLIEEEQNHYNKIVKISDLIAKLGPIFGLLGTLIPLGPGIIALGQGDTYTLSQSLLTAFDTTVAGLIAAAVAMIISAIRKSWYGNYISILETLAECVLEVESNDEKN